MKAKTSQFAYGMAIKKNYSAHFIAMIPEEVICS
jgi:hypothetical protein